VAHSLTFWRIHLRRAWGSEPASLALH
jgi:hypothetical protein